MVRKDSKEATTRVVGVDQEEDEVMMESSSSSSSLLLDDSLASESQQNPNSTTTGGSASRQWQKDSSSSLAQELVPGYSICVGITTRDESLPVYDTPSKMYSSLRYKLHYKCTVDAEKVSPFPKLLMCRITVIDDESGKEIKKDNKPIVDDSLISLKNTSSGTLGVYEANHKIKFKSVSFHHNKSKWRLLLQLFSDSNHSINTPVFVMKSGPFQVYARRPKVSERDGSNGLLSSGSEATISSSTTATTTTTTTTTTTNTTTHTTEDKRKKKTEPQKNKRKRTSSVTMTNNKHSKEEELVVETTSEEFEPPTEESTSAAEESSCCSTLKKVKLMENFKKTLDLLLKYHSEMDDEDKVTGFGLIQQKMYLHFYGPIPTADFLATSMIPMQSIIPSEEEENSTESTTLQCGSADDLFNSSALFSENNNTHSHTDIPVTSHEVNSNFNNNNSSSFDLDYFAPSMSEDFTAFI
ncbi:hypothetical protein FDP41_002386 [Naegleria fowleri]|uniref:Uncharacterized protein n=1 Tax=Naegleria fowleri TaxID=5763 RepID=A0A6A5BTN0_NAEFO|nr:uncharacterized protein FDP41_002386 [Naegleria fowleri]KAF0978566.1 hypothetical protein FDP41_002386 [Naegleria fowleri]